MKTWNSLFFYFFLTFLVVTVAFVSIYEISFDVVRHPWTSVLAATPYIFFALMAIWVNKIFKKKYQKLDAHEKANVDLSNLLAKQPLSPDSACNLIMNLIGYLGKNWWDSFGRNILFKLFYDRQPSDNEKIDYIQQFLREAALPAYQKKASIMMPTIFSMLSVEELAKIVAKIYYFYAVLLLEGTFVAAAKNITLAIQNNAQELDALLPKVAEYAKEIVAIRNHGDEGQKILGIIEGEITKARK